LGAVHKHKAASLQPTCRLERFLLFDRPERAISAQESRNHDRVNRPFAPTIVREEEDFQYTRLDLAFTLRITPFPERH
jgi:hypothetical protein